MSVAEPYDRPEKADLVFRCRDVAVALPHALGARPVLADISFDLHRGEFLTIVGPSGTGKTTLLRVLGGLTPCTSGAVSIHGRPLDGPPEDAVIVFQDYSHALLQWRTVGRNVAFGLEGRVGREELRARVQDALRLVRLEKHEHDYTWQLSGGMQQRVQIARALALRPAVLLMDEPFAALDAMTKAALQDELLRVREQIGSSFVFVTHDIEEAVYLGDRVAVITGTPGRIERIVTVGLPQPRDQIVTRQMPEFLALRRLLHEAIGQGAHG
ncbi:MAG TPA: ABC transporter ATP-binding protein [Xanthobacteraceae bacterium]|nr:ABC transporter ATP-binding protein [Xanthobacteraceae bacterium]